MRTSRPLLVAVIVLASLQAASAQTGVNKKSGELRIDVADAAENAPIPRAFVLIHSNYGVQDVAPHLDVGGRSNVQLTTGLYDVFVSAPGFTPLCRTIEISDHPTTLKARLKPDHEHLQSSLGRSTSLNYR
jgi:hypothetical protein